MYAFVAAGMLLLAAAPGAKPGTGGTKSGTGGSKPAVDLPMPPPPAVAPKPPSPAPPPAPAEKRRRADPPADPLSRLRLGAAIGPALSLSSGFTTGSGVPVWTRFVVRGTFDLLEVGPGQLQALVPVGFQGLGLPRPVYGSVFGFDLMPSIRYAFEAIPELFVYADLGLGFGAYQVTIQQQWIGYLSIGASGFGVRLGAGLEYRLFDQLRLLVEPLGLISLTTSVTSNNVTVTSTASQWSFLFGASYRL